MLSVTADGRTFATFAELVRAAIISILAIPEAVVCGAPIMRDGERSDERSVDVISCPSSVVPSIRSIAKLSVNLYAIPSVDPNIDSHSTSAEGPFGDEVRANVTHGIEGANHRCAGISPLVMRFTAVSASREAVLSVTTVPSESVDFC